MAPLAGRRVDDDCGRGCCCGCSCCCRVEVVVVVDFVVVVWGEVVGSGLGGSGGGGSCGVVREEEEVAATAAAEQVLVDGGGYASFALVTRLWLLRLVGVVKISTRLDRSDCFGLPSLGSSSLFCMHRHRPARSMRPTAARSPKFILSQPRHWRRARELTCALGARRRSRLVDVCALVARVVWQTDQPVGVD